MSSMLLTWYVCDSWYECGISDSGVQSALLKHTLVIIVLSTTGQGDMPRNALLFWKKLLRKKLPPNCLADVRFTSFGLGDSTYVKYDSFLTLTVS